VRRRGARTLAAALLLAATAGCRKAPEWPPPPAPVHLGEDACAECRMLVSEKAFGAQAQDRAGKVRHFDDLGCLLVHARAQAAGGAPVDPAGVYVRALGDGTWIPATSAWIVRSEAIHSPMGYGLAAFASREAAQAEAGRAGHAARTSSLAELLAGGSQDFAQPGAARRPSP